MLQFHLWNSPSVSVHLLQPYTPARQLRSASDTDTNRFHPSCIHKKHLVKDLFLMLAHLFGTICLKHSATLNLPPLLKPPSRRIWLIIISKSTGQMSATQRQEVIVCIPKEGKNKQKTNNKTKTNWRPITLLNNVYKIASSCIAARLKTVLPKLTGDDQKFFLKGRYIGEILGYCMIHCCMLSNIKYLVF